MHIEPGYVASAKILAANAAAIALIGSQSVHLLKAPLQIVRSLLAAVFFTVAMQAFHLPVGPSELHFLGAMPLYLSLGFIPTLFGFAMGLLFAVLYTVLYGRYSSLNPTNLTLVLAGAMFFVLYLVPFLKYPANPPAVGHEDTIRARTGLYLLMVVVSIAALVFAVWLARRLTERFGSWNAALLAGAAFIVIVGIVMLALPSLGQLSTNVAEYGDYATETPQPLKDAAGNIVFPGFPADDLYYFRLYSIGAQIILWATIALGFAPFARRLLGEGEFEKLLGHPADGRALPLVAPCPF